MSGTRDAYSSGRGGCLILLAILFIILKITGVIGWSWWWVLSPILIPLALWIVAMCVYAIAIMVDEWIKDNSTGGM